MNITKQKLAEKISTYLNHSITKEQLIDWCEQRMQEDTFDSSATKEIVAQLGLLDAENFELSYDELYDLLSNLGYSLKVELV
jgi:transposase